MFLVERSASTVHSCLNQLATKPKTKKKKIMKTFVCAFTANGLKSRREISNMSKCF